MSFDSVMTTELEKDMMAMFKNTPFEVRALTKKIANATLSFLNNSKQFNESISETIERENFTLTPEHLLNLAFDGTQPRVIRMTFQDLFLTMGIKSVNDFYGSEIEKQFPHALTPFKALYKHL